VQRRQPKLLVGLHDRPCLARGEHLDRHPEAEREGEQIAGGDRPLSRHCLVEGPVRADEYAAVGELGEQPIDGFLEPEQPLLDAARVAAAVIGLLVEAIRNSESRLTGGPPIPS
jgi:hypothetical protein